MDNNLDRDGEPFRDQLHHAPEGRGAALVRLPGVNLEGPVGVTPLLVPPGPQGHEALAEELRLTLGVAARAGRQPRTEKQWIATLRALIQEASLRGVWTLRFWSAQNLTPTAQRYLLEATRLEREAAVPVGRPCAGIALIFTDLANESPTVQTYLGNAGRQRHFDVAIYASGAALAVGSGWGLAAGADFPLVADSTARERLEFLRGLARRGFGLYPTRGYEAIARGRPATAEEQRDALVWLLHSAQIQVLVSNAAAAIEGGDHTMLGYRAATPVDILDDRPDLRIHFDHLPVPVFDFLLRRKQVKRLSDEGITLDLDGFTAISLPAHLANEISAAAAAELSSPRPQRTAPVRAARGDRKAQFLATMASAEPPVGPYIVAGFPHRQAHLLLDSSPESADLLRAALRALEGMGSPGANEGLIIEAAAALPWLPSGPSRFVVYRFREFALDVTIAGGVVSIATQLAWLEQQQPGALGLLRGQSVPGTIVHGGIQLVQIPVDLATMMAEGNVVERMTGRPPSVTTDPLGRPPTTTGGWSPPPEGLS